MWVTGLQYFTFDKPLGPLDYDMILAENKVCKDLSTTSFTNQEG